MSWNNNDGLFLKFGTEKSTSVKAGEYRFDGPLHMIELDLDLTTVASSAAVASGADQVAIPKNAIVEKIETVARVAAVGVNATLNLGLIRRDRSTEIDFDGLLAAIPTTSMDAVGETVTHSKGSTYAGALVGTTVGATYPAYLSVDYDTAAFTDGRVLVRIYYRFN